MVRLLLIALFLRCSAAALSPHPYIGCPKMKVIEDGWSLAGDYDIVHSHAWRREVDGIWRYLTIDDEGGVFKICDDHFFQLGRCILSNLHNPNGYQAVCVYEPNYCPQLSVTKGSCYGVYYITHHGYWSRDSKSIGIVEGNVFTSDSTQYECFDGEKSQGMVSAVDVLCVNPNINTPLVHGKNVLANGVVLYVVKDFVASPDVISFELAIDAAAEQVAWIWSKNPWGHGKSSYFAFSRDTDPVKDAMGINYINISSSGTNYFKFRPYDGSLVPAVFRILSVRRLKRTSPHGGRIIVGHAETSSMTPVKLSGFPAAPACFATTDNQVNARAAITNVTKTEFTVKFRVPRGTNPRPVNLSSSPFYYLCILADVADMPHLLPGMHGSASTLELKDLGLPSQIEQDIFPGEIGHKIVVGDLQTSRHGCEYTVVSSTPQSDGSYILRADALARSYWYGTPGAEAMGVLKLFRSADPRDPMYGEQRMVEAHPLAPYGGSLEKYAGCPEIYSFADWKGYYQRVSDYHWRLDGMNWNIGLVGKSFCNANADGSCTGFYTTVAMCTAAQHFCPELVVLGAVNSLCRGVYIQEFPYTWTRWSDGARLSVSHFDPIYGRPRYGCYDARGRALGTVHETYCSTPSRVAPIFNGLNVLGDGKTYWIQRPRDMVETSDKITFTMNTMHRQGLNVWMVTNSADIANGGSLSVPFGAYVEGYDRTTFRVYYYSELDFSVTLTKA